MSDSFRASMDHIDAKNTGGMRLLSGFRQGGALQCEAARFLDESRFPFTLMLFDMKTLRIGGCTLVRRTLCRFQHCMQSSGQ